MKKLICAFTFFVFITGLYSQENSFDNGNLKVEFKKAKKVSKTFNLNSSSRIRSKNLKKISVKCRIKSEDKTPVDINKFSLLDHTNKLRYRPVDISYEPVMVFMPYQKLLKENLEINNMYGTNALYDPEVTDSFPDYDRADYFNVEIPFSFGTKKKPKTSVVYFAPHKYAKMDVLFYFAIIVKADNPDFELFYGDEKVVDFEI